MPSHLKAIQPVKTPEPPGDPQPSVTGAIAEARRRTRRSARRKQAALTGGEGGPPPAAQALKKEGSPESWTTNTVWRDDRQQQPRLWLSPFDRGSRSASLLKA